MLTLLISTLLNLLASNLLIPNRTIFLDNFSDPSLTVEAKVFVKKKAIQISYDYYYYNRELDQTYTIAKRVETSIEQNREVFIRVATNYIYSFNSNFEVFKSEEVCREGLIPYDFDKIDSASINKKLLNKYALSLLDLVKTYKYKDSKYFKKLLIKTETLGSLFAGLEISKE